MEKKIYFNRDTVKYVKFDENWHKLKNFQTVRPLTVQQQIERFTSAGKELDKLRGLGVYDFNDNQPLDDELEDVTRDPDFDMIDAAVALRDLQLKRQASQEAGTVAQSVGNETQDKNQGDVSIAAQKPKEDGAAEDGLNTSE